MITNVPSAKDFEDLGLTYLNLAWELAVDINMAHDELARDFKPEPGEVSTVASEYMLRAQKSLALAVALSQQGTDFLLKARIAGVSPYLLLTGSQREWPSGCRTKDVAYADFHTIDAQDLPKLYDTVHSTRLSQEFISEFDFMRRLRNEHTHTVPRYQELHIERILKWCLFSFSELTGRNDWFACRRDYLESKSPGGAVPDHDGCGYGPRVAREFASFGTTLKPGEREQLLGMTRARVYKCPACHFRDAGLTTHPATAQLDPNTPNSTNVKCFACGTNTEITRTNCHNCKGNVVDNEYNYCLSCGENCDLRDR